MKSVFQKLDEASRAYLQQRLRDGNPAAIALANKPLEPGAIHTWVPEVATSRSSYDYDMALFGSDPADVAARPGGVVTRVRSSVDDAVSWFVDELTSKKGSVLISESFLLRAVDMWNASTFPGLTVTSGDFVYHLATGEDDPSVIRTVVESIYRVPLGMGFLTTFRNDELAMTRQMRQLSEPTMASAVSGATAIAVEVFDGESLMVWNKTEREDVV